MNRVYLLVVALVAIVSCKSEPNTTVAPLKSETDSLAYIIGMNIADNLMAMDSTINVNVVCRAIAEQAKSKSLMTTDEAKIYYLRYLTYVEPERMRGYEEQYLVDLVKSDRRFARSKSGLTYEVEVIGDESFTPRATNDLISLRYTITRVDGEQIYSSYDAADTTVLALRDLSTGVQESLKLIGKGGKINAWIPSQLAFGEAGDSLLNVKPFETLYYQMEMIDMERNGAQKVVKKAW